MSTTSRLPLWGWIAALVTVAMMLVTFAASRRAVPSVWTTQHEYAERMARMAPQAERAAGQLDSVRGRIGRWEESVRTQRDAAVRSYVRDSLVGPAAAELARAESTLRALGDSIAAAGREAAANAGPEPPADSKPLVIKLIVTAVLGLAALYVVLSGEYDQETRKWAFSVLSLIAGVWIGSATS